MPYIVAALIAVLIGGSIASRDNGSPRRASNPAPVAVQSEKGNVTQVPTPALLVPLSAFAVGVLRKRRAQEQSVEGDVIKQ